MKPSSDKQWQADLSRLEEEGVRPVAATACLALQLVGILLVEGILVTLALCFNKWYFVAVAVWPIFACVLAYHKLELGEQVIGHMVATEHRCDMVHRGACGSPACIHMPYGKGAGDDHEPAAAAHVDHQAPAVVPVTPSQTTENQELLLLEARIMDKLGAAGIVNQLDSFSYQTLVLATDNFRHSIDLKLGQDDNHKVTKNLFRGVDPSSGRAIAVKQLAMSASWAQELEDELVLGSRSLSLMVPLLGYCAQAPLLVYRYMPNGSLDNWMFHQATAPGLLLDWNHRMFIAVSLAKGLAELHDAAESHPPVHLDLKPENILLTERLEPKLWTGGAAAVELGSCTDLAQILLTRGYVAPEVLLLDDMVCASAGACSHKSHMFSYGMVLLELVSGRRNRDDSLAVPEQRYFPAWAQHCINRQTMTRQAEEEEEQDEAAADDLTGEELNLVDERLRGAFDAGEARNLIKLGLWCVQTDPALRPQAAMVVHMLQGGVEVSVPPLILGFARALKRASSLLDCCSSHSSGLSLFSDRDSTSFSRTASQTSYSSSDLSLDMEWSSKNEITTSQAS